MAYKVLVECERLPDLIRVVAFSSMSFETTPYIFYDREERLLYYRILYYSPPMPPVHFLFIYRMSRDPREAYIEYSYLNEERWNWVSPGQIRDPSKVYVAIYFVDHADEFSHPTSERIVKSLDALPVFVCEAETFDDLARLAAFSGDIVLCWRENAKWRYACGLLAGLFLLSGSRNTLSPFVICEGPAPKVDGLRACFIRWDDHQRRAVLARGVSAKEYFAPLCVCTKAPIIALT